jgi:hypothetical protein
MLTILLHIAQTLIPAHSVLLDSIEVQSAFFAVGVFAFLLCQWRLSLRQPLRRAQDPLE